MPALIEVTLPAPVEDVWAHLRDPALIRRWFGWEYEGLAHEIGVIFLQEAAVDEPSWTVRWDDGMQDGDRIQLAGDGERTTLRVVRGAPEAGYDPIAEGWISFVQQLRFALERHPGEDRRTLRLGPTSPARLPPETAGEVYFRTEHQLGLVVDDGLLVAWEKPADAEPPDGAASMVLSSYGDARPDEAAWRAWWDSR